jgi:rhodanese-related sulfurtransferase
MANVDRQSEGAVPRITPAQAQELIATGDALVVDVRDDPEVQQSGKVAGAVHVPRELVASRADANSPDYDSSFAKDKPVILYCGAGGRAAAAGEVLKELGYGEVYNMGGFGDWVQHGGAVDRP